MSRRCSQHAKRPKLGQPLDDIQRHSQQLKKEVGKLKAVTHGIDLTFIVCGSPILLSRRTDGDKSAL